MKCKSRTIFIHFYILEFYPSSFNVLLLKNLNLIRNFIDFTQEQIKIIATCRKSLLTDSKFTWMKNLMFPRANSAQIPDVIEINILDTLDRIIDHKQIGL